MKKIAWKLALSIPLLALTGCGVLQVAPTSEPYQSPTAAIETASPEPVVSADDERYQFINQMADELDYKSAGRIVSEDRMDGTSSMLSLNVGYEYSDETYQTLKERMKSISKTIGVRIRDCEEIRRKEFYKFSCASGNIQVNLERDKMSEPELKLEIRDVDDAKWRERKLMPGPMVKGDHFGYNVANGEMGDRCTWDRGSDGKPEIVDIPCKLETFMDDGSSAAKMTVTVTDVAGKKYVLHSEVPVLDPAIIDQIVGGMVGSK